MLLERFGTRPLERLLAAGDPLRRSAASRSRRSLSQAHHGVRAGQSRSRVAAHLRRRRPRPGAGRRCSCSRTSRARCATSATEGPDLFYRGRVAQAIAERMAADGFLTADDLARAHAASGASRSRRRTAASRSTRRRRRRRALTALIGAQHARGLPARASSPLHSAEHLHLLLEIDQARLRRPRPLDRRSRRTRGCRSPALLDKGYAADAPPQPSTRRRRRRYAAGDPEGDTTGFVVADGQGNVVSVIQSLFNAFGSGVVPPGTGVLPAEPRPPLQRSTRRIRARSRRASDRSTR